MFCAGFWYDGGDEEEANGLRRHKRTGSALGDDSFLERLENALQRPLKRQKAGRKKQSKE